MNAAKITRVRSRIAKHREGRHPRSPLPPELWAEATAIAGEVGAYAASRQLGVSYESLRARLDARKPSPRAAKPQPEPEAPVFVELDGTTPWPLGAGGPTIEIVEASGAKLTICGGTIDVAQVVRAFRQERS